MFNTIRFSAITVVFILLFAGCQSHQAKIDALQKEYDRLSLQYRQDCSAEMLNIPPKLSQKCSDEGKSLDEAWKRLQAERLKK
jgi:hypothetical protein